MPGVNYCEDCPIFEAVPGVAPDIAGKGITSPIALPRLTKLMLEYLNFTEMACNIEHTAGRIARARGGLATMDGMRSAILQNLR